MSHLIDNIEQTLGRARRSRKRALKMLDILDSFAGGSEFSPKPSAAARVSIAWASLTLSELSVANVALNMNRPALER
jgi:hypothetical protein